MARLMPSSTAGSTPTHNTAAKTSTDSNQLTAVGESIAVTAAQLTLGAVFGNIRVPKGAEIAFVQFAATDVDTNGTPLVTFEIGDTGDTDRLMTANTGGQTGAIPYMGVATTGFGYRYTDETLVSIRCSAIPATAAAGTLKYIVHYVSQ